EVILVVWGGGFRFAVPFEPDALGRDLDAEVLLGHAWHLCSDHDGCGSLYHLDRGLHHFAFLGPTVPMRMMRGATRKEVFKDLIHLAPEGAEKTLGFPLFPRHSRPAFLPSGDGCCSYPLSARAMLGKKARRWWRVSLFGKVP